MTRQAHHPMITTTPRAALQALALALALCLTLFAASAQAQGATGSYPVVGCTKIGFQPGTPDPNVCFTLEGKAPAPAAVTAAPGAAAQDPGAAAQDPAGNGASSAARNTSTTTSTAQSAITQEGDSVRSTVAVFPAPSAAPVPQASGCIATRSRSGGIGWNLMQGAATEQYSEPVCVLMWLLARASTQAQAEALQAEILRRLPAAAAP